MKKIVALWLVWALCGFVAWGISIGHWTCMYPSQSHVGISAIMAVAGPFGIAGMLTTAPIRWRIKPLTYEQRWQVFHAEYSVLSREDFDAQNGLIEQKCKCDRGKQ